MEAEIIIVPTQVSMEMLKSLAQTLAQELVSQGIQVNEEISLCPDRRRLQHAIGKALERSDLLFTLGGMGKDSGFLAKQVMSEGLGLPLEHSPDSMLAIEDYAARRGILISPDDATLASLPAGSTPLLPSRGILPGAMISSPTQHIVMLPENAEEILPMLSRQVMPLLAKAGVSADSTHSVQSYGATEEQVRQMIADLLGTTNPVVSTHSHGEEVEVRVSAKGLTSREASEISTSVLRTIATRLGDYAYGLDVHSLEEAVIEKLNRKNITIAVAEAGTGSSLINRIARIPKGNQLLEAAFVVEDNESKIIKLGLAKKKLRRRGDVSEWAAVAMADAARMQGNTHLGVGLCAHIPGHKQNGGATAFIAVCNGEDVYVKKILVEADHVVDHKSVVNAAVSRGLNMLRLFVDYLPDSYPGSVSLEEALAGKITVTDKESYELGDEFLAHDEEYEEAKNKKGSSRKQRKNSKKNSRNEERGSQSKMRRLVLIIAVGVFLFGAIYMGNYFVKSVIARGLRDDLAVMYDTTGIQGLHSQNSDTVGFVSLEGTNMRYPVVQGKDNDYYLRRDFYEKNNQHGVPFLDYRGNPKKPSTNLVIYGHNMKDGQIFGELLNYVNLDYYQKSPVVQYEGLQKKADYKIFSIFKTSAEPSHFNDGVVFNYPKFVEADSGEEFDEYIKQVRIRSIINTPVDVKFGDEIITLSTCDYDVMDSRFVVMARKVRSGESSDVDTASAVMNPNPLYPDIWYKTYGGTKPDINNWSYNPETTTPKKDKTPVKETPKVEDPEDEDKPVEKPKEEVETLKTNETDNSAALEAQRAAEAQQAAEKKAEEDRIAEEARKVEEEKNAEAEAAKQAEEDKKLAEAKAKEDAEGNAIAESNKAASAAKEASNYQQSALNSRTQKEAQGHADSARAAATRANEAAAAAKTAAELSGTQRASEAAQSAESSASDANRSADTAQETVSYKGDDDYEVVDTVGTLRVSANGNYDPNDSLDLITRVVQNEVGTTFHSEAVKAQAVAAYTFIAQSNAQGSTPSVVLATKADPNIKKLVGQVLGEAVYYNGSLAFTPYHATSAGATTSSRSVWGGSYPYLVSVDSSVDENAWGYQSTTTMSSDKVASLVSQKLGIETTGDPDTWFQVLSQEDGGYNGQMSVCGESRSRSGTQISGRLLREAVFGLRSAAFDIKYNSSTDNFTFTTYGYGHGVGMSQTGANQYAQQGWTYVDILQHYYPGAVVQ